MLPGIRPLGVAAQTAEPAKPARPDGGIASDAAHVSNLRSVAPMRTTSPGASFLGRSKECDIQIADPNASRRHAELRREGDAYWLVDLGSTNGLDVNGKRTQRAKLANGDRVTIGTTELVFGTEGA